MIKQLVFMFFTTLSCVPMFSQGFNSLYYTNNLFADFAGVGVYKDTVYVRGGLKLTAQDAKQRIMVTQLDKSGQILKHKFYADTNKLITLEGRMLTVDKSGSILTVFAKGGEYITKLDKDLNILKTKKISRDSITEVYYFHDIVEIDSGYLVFTTINMSDPKNQKIQLSILTLDYDLNIKKEKIIEPTLIGNRLDMLDIKKIDNEIYLMYDEYSSNFEDLELSNDLIKLVKYDIALNTLQTIYIHDFKKSGYILPIGFEKTKKGSWIFVGRKSKKIYVGKNAAVPMLWVYDKNFKETYRGQFTEFDFHEYVGDLLNRVIKSKDGFYVLGDVINPQNYVGSCMIIKLNEDGIPLWQRFVQPPPVNGIQRYGSAFGGATLSDDNLIVTGTSGNRAGWIFCMTPDGCVLQNDCSVATATAEQTDILFRVYPNPAQDVLHIESESSEGIKQILVYDNIGAQVYKSDCQSGNDIEVNASCLANGIYLLRVQYQNGQVSTAKVSILK